MALSIPRPKIEEKKTVDFISLWEEAADKIKREACNEDIYHQERNNADDVIKKLFR